MPPHAIGLDLRMHISHLGGVPDPALRPLAFFAHERGDARVMKRIAALQDQGRRVIGFTFHRVRDKPDVPPGWQNVHLGTTYNRRYLQRLCALAKAVGVLCAFFRIAGGGGVEGGETALRGASAGGVYGGAGLCAVRPVAAADRRHGCPG